MTATVVDKLVDDVPFALFGNLFEAILVFCGCSQFHGFRPTTTPADTSLRQRFAWSPDLCERNGLSSGLQNVELLKVAHRWTRVLSGLSYRFSEQT